MTDVADEAPGTGTKRERANRKTGSKKTKPCGTQLIEAITIFLQSEFNRLEGDNDKSVND